VFDDEPPIQPGPPLSDRERQVLSLLAAGKTNREIASLLCLSPHTVKDYVSDLYRKIGVNGRIQAVTRAGELGLID
jgi:DNA-binding NarL/FixJ family response regulator